MNQTIKGWKPKAFDALAKYFALLEERESYEARIEEAQRACERAGVRFRYGSPEVPTSNEAYACACGTVIPDDYDTMMFLKKHPGAQLYCNACREKSAAAAKEDAKIEATPPSEETDDDALLSDAEISATAAIAKAEGGR